MAGTSPVLVSAEAVQQRTEFQQQTVIKEAAAVAEMATAAGAAAETGSILANVRELGDHLHPG